MLSINCTIHGKPFLKCECRLSLNFFKIPCAVWIRFQNHFCKYLFMEKKKEKILLIFDLVRFKAELIHQWNAKIFFKRWNMMEQKTWQTLWKQSDLNILCRVELLPMFNCSNIIILSVYGRLDKKSSPQKWWLTLFRSSMVC